jgi:hypothetical protein
MLSVTGVITGDIATITRVGGVGLLAAVDTRDPRSRRPATGDAHGQCRPNL